MLAPFLWLERARFPWSRWPQFAAIGLVNTLIPFLLFAWSAQRAPAGVSANRMAVRFASGAAGQGLRGLRPLTDTPAARGYTRRMLRPACPFPILPAALFAIVAALATGACSQQGPAPPTAPSASAQAAANEAAAQKELKLYQQMLDEHSGELAAPVGQEIVQKYPGTSAAAEVQKTLPEVTARSKAKAEHDRLANLWYYQTANMDGLQHTASIYSSQPSGSERVRLVLRRHVKWGQSVYLFAPDGSKGFVCKGTCKIVMHVDGKRETWKAYLPKTGEPAMFIQDDKRFIAMLKKAKLITMDVDTKDHGKQTLKFEVGGYDPAKFTPLPKR